MLELDYYKIGQRIRHFRKAKGLSQEELSEAAGISVTHMSHIETGNTKLSLPVFAALADILDVHADELLKDSAANRSTAESEIIELLNGASAYELNMSKEIIHTVQAAVRKYKDH